MGVLIFLNVNIYRKLIETRKKRVRSKTLAAAGASTNTAVTNLTVNTVAGSEAWVSSVKLKFVESTFSEKNAIQYIEKNSSDIA